MFPRKSVFNFTVSWVRKISVGGQTDFGEAFITHNILEVFSFGYSRTQNGISQQINKWTALEENNKYKTLQWIQRYLAPFLVAVNVLSWVKQPFTSFSQMALKANNAAKFKIIKNTEKFAGAQLENWSPQYGNRHSFKCSQILRVIFNSKKRYYS